MSKECPLDDPKTDQSHIRGATSLGNVIRKRSNASAPRSLTQPSSGNQHTLNGSILWDLQLMRFSVAPASGG
jgi:hypothetical protein